MVIFEAYGAHAGRPIRTLPRNYMVRRPLSSKVLAGNLKRLAYTVRDRGYEADPIPQILDAQDLSTFALETSDEVYPRYIASCPLSSMFRKGTETINKLVGVDLYQLVQRNTDLFILPLTELHKMTYEEFAEFLEAGAARLEALK